MLLVSRILAIRGYRRLGKFKPHGAPSFFIIHRIAAPLLWLTVPPQARLFIDVCVHCYQEFDWHTNRLLGRRQEESTPAVESTYRCNQVRALRKMQRLRSSHTLPNLPSIVLPLSIDSTKAPVQTAASQLFQGCALVYSLAFNFCFSISAYSFLA